MFSDALQHCLALRFSANFMAGFFFDLSEDQTVVSHCLKWEGSLELAQPLCRGESAD